MTDKPDPVQGCELPSHLTRTDWRRHRRAVLRIRYETVTCHFIYFALLVCVTMALPDPTLLTDIQRLRV